MMKRANGRRIRAGWGTLAVALGAAACVCSGATVPMAATQESFGPTLDAGIDEELGFAPGATSPPEPTLDIALPTLPDDTQVLEELFFGPLGGGDDSPCGLAGGGAIFAAGYTFDDTVFPNGDTIPLPAYSTDTRLDFWESGPRVCARDATYLESVTVLSPWGETFSPRRPDSPDNVAAYLPVEAFPYSGAWTIRVEDLGQFPELGMETFEVTYLIPPPAEGVVYGIAADGAGLAGGFLPGERVMVIIVGEGRIESTTAVQADGDGLIRFDASTGDSEFVLVGEVGPEHVLLGQRLDTANDDSRETLYRMYWGE